MKSQNFYHILKIKSEFELRLRKNAKYSLRAYSRDLGMSPAALSGLLNRKKGLSRSRAEQLAFRLGLSENESEKFLLSSILTHGRSANGRSLAKKKLSEHRKSSDTSRTLEVNDFSAIQAWYHLAILEVLELPDVEHTAAGIAARLGISVQLAKLALEALLRTGFIAYKAGKYCSVTIKTATTNDRAAPEIRSYHVQILEKAIQALQIQALQAREFQSVTLAFDSSRVAEAKKAIRKFHGAFAKEFYPQNRTKDSVYQISIQLFRLDKDLK